MAIDLIAFAPSHLKLKIYSIGLALSAMSVDEMEGRQLCALSNYGIKDLFVQNKNLK